MSKENKINYIEIPVTDPAKARTFFDALYGRRFHFVDPTGDDAH